MDEIIERDPEHGAGAGARILQDDVRRGVRH
jgi:hypothetical protein